MIYGFYGGMNRLFSGHWPGKDATIFFAVLALFVAFMNFHNDGSDSGGCYREWDGRTNPVVCE